MHHPSDRRVLGFSTQAMCVVADDRVLLVNHLGLNLRPALLSLPHPLTLASGHSLDYSWLCLGLQRERERAIGIYALTPLIGPFFPFSLIFCYSPTSILFSSHIGCFTLFLIKPTLCFLTSWVCSTLLLAWRASPKFLITGSALKRGPLKKKNRLSKYPVSAGLPLVDLWGCENPLRVLS